MTSMFKDYSKKETRLYMTEDEFKKVNLKGKGEKHLD